MVGADLVVKVKDPLPDEVALLRRGAVLFTYLHLAANRDLTRRLLDADVIAHRVRDDPQPATARSRCSRR